MEGRNVVVEARREEKLKSCFCGFLCSELDVAFFFDFHTLILSFHSTGWLDRTPFIEYKFHFHWMSMENVWIMASAMIFSARFQLLFFISVVTLAHRDRGELGEKSWLTAPQQVRKIIKPKQATAGNLRKVHSHPFIIIIIHMLDSLTFYFIFSCGGECGSEEKKLFFIFKFKFSFHQLHRAHIHMRVRLFFLGKNSQTELWFSNLKW